MRLLMTAVIALVALTLSMTGCSDKGGQEGLPGQESAAGSKEGGSMAVMVNGREVSEELVAQEINRLHAQLSGRASQEQIDSMKEMIRQQALDNMINRVLLEQQVEKNEIEVTDEQIDERAGQVKQNFDSDEAFNEHLMASGLTEAGFMQEVELAIGIEMLLEKETSGLATTNETEARTFYDENVNRFEQPEQIRASHILIRAEEGETEEQKTEKRKRIEALLEQARGGADFATLARENSDCPSKERGGDLGFFGRGQMVREFEDAAFALQAGQISGIVETQFGYHIIKKTEERPATTVPFGDTKSDIIAFLDSQKRQQAITVYIDSLRTAATIVYPDTSSSQ